MGPSLYFAYGSNLDLSGKLRNWAPSATLVGAVQAPRRRFSFTRLSPRWGARAADILPHAWAVTWGALFEVDPAEMVNIDACEGVPYGYRRITVELESPFGPCSAFSYEVVDRHLPEAPPAPAYIATILDGARQVGLPDHWITYLEGIAVGSFPPYPA